MLVAYRNAGNRRHRAVEGCGTSGRSPPIPQVWCSTSTDLRICHTWGYRDRLHNRNPPLVPGIRPCPGSERPPVDKRHTHQRHTHGERPVSGMVVTLVHAAVRRDGPPRAKELRDSPHHPLPCPDTARVAHSVSLFPRVVATAPAVRPRHICPASPGWSSSSSAGRECLRGTSPGRSRPRHRPAA